MRRIPPALVALVLLVSCGLGTSSSRPTAGASHASFFVRCTLAQVRQIDPLKSPGMVPSMHMHQFFGAKVGPSTKPKDLASLPSTCPAVDHSAYWAPTLVDANGVEHPAADANAYYIAGPYDVVSFPPDTALFGSVAKFTCGTGTWADLTAGQVPFSCAGLGGAVNGNSAVFPRIVVYFPNCLRADGSIGYAGACVARTPQLQLDLRFEHDRSLDGLHPSSGAWSTMHADYMFGWDQAAFGGLIRRCLATHIVCARPVS